MKREQDLTGEALSNMCGCNITVFNKDGSQIPGSDWLLRVCEFLKTGHIIAIKGISGYHLACNAFDSKAVAELRRRKGRPAKPFAVMCRDIETAKSLCYTTPDELAYLTSPASPIVLLKSKSNNELPYELTCGLATLGVMLPYTHLHKLILSRAPRVLVMTSGNVSGLPSITTDTQALDTLSNIADFFIFHDQDICSCDDSVLSVADGEVCFIRRSRGYVPQPISVPICTNGPIVLSLGSDSSNTFCLLSENLAYPSQHMGDMDTIEAQENLEKSVEEFCTMLGISPQVITSDLHPDYYSREVANRLARRFGAIRHPGVQHHHAHLAACMGENNIDENVIGIILDGTGFGLDDKIWGFEVLHGDYSSFSREYHLKYTPLPGGNTAIQNPWITAIAYVITLLGNHGKDLSYELFPRYSRMIRLVEQVLSKKLNAPLASSCGRLFDAVSALLGLCLETTYEGQAAIHLSDLLLDQVSTASFRDLTPYTFTIEDTVINPMYVFEQICNQIRQHLSCKDISKQFHDTVVAMVTEAAKRIREKTGISQVVLSGGCWQNHYLRMTTKQILQESEFEVFTHRLIPPGDGGLALGQAMIAYKQMQKQ